MTITNDHNKMYSSFSAFIDEWGKQFSDVRNILSYLNTYPDLMSSIELKSLHDSESILPEQEDWVRISAKFDHPLEKEFFKPYWIPIVRDSIDYFIDLSDANYPIFEAHFIFFEPYNWHKQFLSEDIGSLLLAHDENINLQQILKNNEDKRWNQVQQFFELRRELGLKGNLKIDQITKDEIELDESIPLDIRKNQNNTIDIFNTTSLIIGLIPFDQKIKLKYVETNNGNMSFKLEDVKTIKDLVFLFRNEGSLRIKKYSVQLEQYMECNLDYGNNQLRINRPFDGCFEILGSAINQL